MKNNGKSFGIVRVYQSNGKVDPNGPSSISNAWKGGMSHVDGYIFPCYSCGNAAGQIDATVNNLSGTKYGMLWLDIEGTQYWSSTASNNVKFLHEMVDRAQAKGVSLGIYSSNSQWTPIMGSSHDFASLPLWYAHYDGVDNYSDFAAFGGWSKPSIKQYAGTTSTCSASVDLNYY